jgi:hypothetical protein
MKKLLFAYNLIGLFFLTALPVLSQKADFTGYWTLDRTKSSVVTDQPTMIKLQVRMTTDSLITVRVYDRGDNQEYPFDEKLGLDGKECNITIYDMPRRSKAGLSESDGTLAFESTTTFSTDSGTADFKSKEIWKLDKEKKILIIDFRNSMAGNDTAGTWFYSYSERL